jgi:prevent-host-death family protein
MTMTKPVTFVPAGEFKSRCLALLDSQQSYVITKRGRPVARLIPLSSGKLRTLRGSLLADDGLMDPVDADWESAR